MEFKLYSELLNDTDIMSYVFLECLPEEASLAIADKNNKILEEVREKNKHLKKEELEKLLDQTAAKLTVDIELKIGGYDVDPRRFFQLFSDQMDDVIKKTADRIVKEQTSDKLTEVSDKIFQLQEILNDMSKDINWEYDQKKHPFIKPEKLDVSEVSVQFMEEDCSIQLNRYSGTKAISIQLWAKDGPMCKATINVVTEELEPDEVIIKNHGENAGILDALINTGVVFKPHREIYIKMPEPYSGFPLHVCKLNLKLPEGF